MTLKLVDMDRGLVPYEGALERRRRRAMEAGRRVAGGDDRRLADGCCSYLYYGLHRVGEEWVLREWAPGATGIYVIGEFNDWRRHPGFAMRRVDGESWEIRLPGKVLEHGTRYRLLVEWEGGRGERLPSHGRRMVQDPYTKVFSAEVWEPAERYAWKHERPGRVRFPMVYEAHVGMATEHRRVGTFREFEVYVLPRVVRLGYNTVQLMAVQEHPYYGSFGYQVSNFFAVSSRFGTPEDLKRLVDAAHGMGLRVVMDLVQSHAVSNEAEGLSRFDGTETQYFHAGARGWHPAWGSRCFDYGKPGVVNFLLSNCKYWLEEFRFDGFRFDGVTSMLYLDHGLGRDFGDYGLYFGEGVDEDAVTYLTLANRLVHEVYEGAVTVAEDVSGMPGLAAPVEWGGMGFDFRLSMGVPAYWTKLLERERDEDWHVGDLFFELTRKRVEERTIGYAESHDQALVGDKTIFHRLVDREVYEGMAAGQGSMVVDRGMALHKMIRLATAGTAGDGYLCFMGNEWGHPEWIDFPREGNGWSYAYARRQWSLVDDEGLRFRFLNDFDGAMVRLAEESGWYGWRPEAVVQDVEGQVLAWRRGDWLFVFNFSPGVSREGYGFGVTAGKYVVALGTDEARFDGLGRTRRGEEHFTIPREGLPAGDGWLRLYLPARTGMVLHRE